MFEASVYSARRKELMGRMGAGAILFPGSTLVGMNYRANTYPFRQDGSFTYYAGLNVPDLALGLDCDTGEEILFGREPSLDDVIWSGSAPSLEELACNAGVERTLPLRCLSDWCRSRPVRHLPAYRADQVLMLSHALGRSPEEVEAGTSPELIRNVVAQRSIKTAAEVEEIRAAVELSARMYEMVMAHCRPGMTERELYGRAQGMIAASGSMEAFPMILTRSGQVLHNHAHHQILSAGDLLLVDSGVCSPLGYASDITRTLPVSGNFASRQRDVYGIVMRAQRAGIKHMKPGVPFLECHLAAARAVAAGLRELGLMRGDIEEAVAAGAHALFFPHGLGHMLGIDVHDMESLGEDFVGYDQEFQRSGQFGLSGLRLARRLEAGFVVTVEPGVYFIPALIARWREQGLHADFINYAAVEQYMGFGGIRLEDDILVTETGTEILSHLIPLEPGDVCARMATASQRPFFE